MTLSGTNTYLYGSDPCIVIDPGPRDDAHLASIHTAAEIRGGIDAVLLTHSHGDHAEGAPDLGERVLLLSDGEARGGLRAIATPGHAPDHVCLLSEDGVCFSGDLILGEGSTIVPPDGGSLTAYLASLTRLGTEEIELICPGHGPWVTEPKSKVEEYVEHRLSRERSLVAALGRGVRSRAALLQEAWHDVPASLQPAAAMVMQAHLEKLAAEGRLPEDLTE